MMCNRIILSLLVLCFTLCNASLHEYQEDYYGSYYKKGDISEIPQLGDANPLVNLRGEATRRDYFFDDLIKAKGSPTPVFKIQMERERVIISDPIAIRALYDRRKITKSKSGVSVEYNDIISGGYTPSNMDNGNFFHTRCHII